MRKWIHTGWLSELIAALFIFLFLYTAISKISEYYTFRTILLKSPLIKPYAGPLSWLLPVTEIITSILLFLPFTRKFGLILSLGLMAIFTIYVTYMVLFVPNLPCSCGGVLKELSWNQHIIFNLFFTALGILALWLTNKHKLFIAINRDSRIPV